MKTLVISDLHLTEIFDKHKADFLKHLVSSCDSVILNGDFWDGYKTTFNAFVASDWKHLFPLLKRKKTIYLYGNHDQEKFCDDRVSLFSISQKNNYQLKSKETIYHVEHGHELYPTLDKKYPLSRKTLHYINAIFKGIEYILVLCKSPHNFILKRRSKKIKKKLRNMHFPHWCLCGHVHYGEIDHKNMFANSGFIQYGKASYLIIDSLGLHLHKNRYK